MSPKVIILLAGTAIILFLTLVIATVILRQRSSSAAPAPTPVPAGQTNMLPTPVSTAGTASPVGFPRVTVNAWDVSGTVANATAAAYVYPVLEPDDQLVQQITGQLQHSPQVISQNGALYRLEKNGDESISYFKMDATSGAFQYISAEGLSLPPAVKDPQTTTTLFLHTLGLTDDTLQYVASYKRKSVPGAVFYELHRTQNSLGLPVANRTSLLSLEDSASFLQALAGRAFHPDSPDIYATTDGTDGKARGNDFNTLTVGLNETDGKLLSIDSTIRLIDTAKRKGVALIPFETAKTRLLANQYDALVTAPVGEGLPDVKTMYPDHKGTLTTATVTDVFVAYVENDSNTTQTAFIPYYVFHGTGILTTGYTVRFVATVKATDDTVLGVYTAQNNTYDPGNNGGIQQGRLGGDTTTDTPAPPKKPKVPKSPKATNKPGATGQPTSEPAPDNCHPSAKDLTNIFDLTGKGDMVGLDSGTNSFFLLNGYNKGANDPILQSFINGLKKNSSPAVQAYVSKYGNTDCPVWLSGFSPALFVYVPVGQKVRVQPDFPVSYADSRLPRATGWTFTGQGLSSPDYLYYEHTVGGWQPSSQGWVIQKQDLGIFVTGIAKQLQLTNRESTQLHYELDNAVRSVSGTNLAITLLDEKTVNAKLPLRVSDRTIPVRRIFFTLSAAPTAHSLQTPVLSPMDRTSPFMLELGALPL